jgi:hypothetical protein
MPHGSLEDPIAKLQRAVEHYLLIKGVLGGRDHPPVSMRMVSSQDGLRYDFYAEDVPPLPANLPLMLGDAYYNLRGALDHLVYQLHGRHYRGNIPEKIAEATQFPIRTEPPKSSPDKWQSIKNLSGKERTAIAWLQPYRQRKDSFYGFREHLADINAINNVDKHRKLHIVRSVPASVPIMASLPSYGVQYSPAFGAPVESGSLINTWTFERKPPEATMSRNWKFYTAAVFDAGGYLIDLMPNLGGSIHAVSEIINRFSHLFPAPALPQDLSQVHPVEALL